MKKPFNKSSKVSLANLKKQSGVLLIEAMIAILIFSFGLLGLVGLQVSATQSSMHAEERIQASLAANNMVSMLWVRQSLTHASVAADVAAWKASVAANAGLPNATGDVTIAGNVATITITWKAPSKKASDNASQYVTSIAMKS